MKTSFQFLIASIASVLFVSSGCVKRVAVSPATHDGEVIVDRTEFFALAKGRLDTRDSAMSASRFNSPVIQPGDQLAVAIYEKLPVSLEKRIEMKRVNDKGLILLPPIGIIRLGGLALTEAAKVIENALKQYIVSPYCEIEITEKGYQPQVYIFGEVQASGAYALRSGDRLLDALSSAGGTGASAYNRSVKIIRQYGPKVGMLSINLVDIMDKGLTSDNVALQDQDIIFVPRRFYTSFTEVVSALSNVIPWYFFIRNL